MSNPIKNFLAELPKILDDAKKFNEDFCGFKGKDGSLEVKVHALNEEKFTEKKKAYGANSIESFIDFDNNVYLNLDALNDEFYRERIISIVSYAYPFLFVFQETPYGKFCKAQRTLTSNYLPGIAKAVELEAVRWMPGYRLRSFEKKLLEDIDYMKAEQPAIYEGYEFSMLLKERAQKFNGDINKEARDRVLKAAVLAAGRDENFDINFKRLSTLPIEELYELAGATVVRPDKTLVDLVNLAEDIKQRVNNREQWRYIKPDMEKLCDKLRLKGLPLSLRKLYETHFNNCNNMESIEPFKKELVDPTRELLEEVEKECKMGMDRPIKIIFY